MTARAAGPRRAGVRLAAALSGFALLAGAAIALHDGSDPTRLPAGSYVLRANSGQLPDLLDEVRDQGGTVTRQFDSIEGAAVTVDADTASDLANDDRVASFTPDVDMTAPSESTAAPAATPVATPKPATPVAPIGTNKSTENPSKTTKTTKTKQPKTGPKGGATPTGSGASYDAAADPNSLCNIAKLVGVRPMWKQGGTGKGVDVALIDSGVAPVAGLNGAGKVVNGPDLTPESQNPNTRYLDTFGHGTHMAGIIAGKDAGVDTSNASSCAGFAGMAPDARIISVKAADAHGATDVSQIIAGIDWVVQHAQDPGMNIRVLNLSFGTDGVQDYVLDPLAYAAEVAWRKGIVVVVSAGNSGFRRRPPDQPGPQPARARGRRGRHQGHALDAGRHDPVVLQPR